MKTKELVAESLPFLCDYCEAQPGEPCRTYKGGPTQFPHQHRLRRYWHARKLQDPSESRPENPCDCCGAAIGEPCKDVGDIPIKKVSLRFRRVTFRSEQESRKHTIQTLHKIRNIALRHLCQESWALDMCGHPAHEALAIILSQVNAVLFERESIQKRGDRLAMESGLVRPCTQTPKPQPPKDPEEPPPTFQEPKPNPLCPLCHGTGKWVKGCGSRCIRCFSLESYAEALAAYSEVDQT